MKYLVDTNILLWFLEDNRNLPSAMREIIEGAENKIFVSIASLWEIAIRVTLGKLTLDTDFDAVLADLERQQILILPVRPEHLRQLLTLPAHHRDPFDRLLVAQSLSENIEMLFTDSLISAYFGS